MERKLTYPEGNQKDSDTYTESGIREDDIDTEGGIEDGFDTKGGGKDGSEGGVIHCTGILNNY